MKIIATWLIKIYSNIYVLSYNVVHCSFMSFPSFPTFSRRSLSCSLNPSVPIRVQSTVRAWPVCLISLVAGVPPWTCVFCALTTVSSLALTPRERSATYCSTLSIAHCVRSIETVPPALRYCIYISVSERLPRVFWSRAACSLFINFSFL